MNASLPTLKRLGLKEIVESSRWLLSTLLLWPVSSLCALFWVQRWVMRTYNLPISLVRWSLRLFLNCGEPFWGTFWVGKKKKIYQAAPPQRPPTPTPSNQAQARRKKRWAAVAKEESKAEVSRCGGFGAWGLKSCWWNCGPCWWFSDIRQTHQWRLVVYPIGFFIHPRWLAGFLNHQQYPRSVSIKFGTYKKNWRIRWFPHCKQENVKRSPSYYGNLLPVSVWNVRKSFPLVFVGWFTLQLLSVAC